MDSDKISDAAVVVEPVEKKTEIGQSGDTSSRTGSDGSGPPSYEAFEERGHDNPALEVTADAETSVDAVAVVINGIEASPEKIEGRSLVFFRVDRGSTVDPLRCGVDRVVCARLF